MLTYILSIYIVKIVEINKEQTGYMSKKSEKFRDLATKRVNRVVHDLELVGNLSNRSAYEYSEREVRLIMRAIDESVAETKRRFRAPGDKKTMPFSLGGDES